MSGFGGFGFGQNNNQQQQSSPFGGFGSATNTNTGTGFGSTNTTGGFGSTNTTGGGLFGGGSTGFGSSGGGFGSTTNTSFGAPKPAFGSPATTGGSLFGAGTTTANNSTGFGGFGSSATGNTTSAFGGGSSGGGLFGTPKPAFGGSTTTSAFGGAATTSPFGGATTTAFGSPASTALSGGVGESPGTGSVPFQPFIEKEPNSSTNQQNAFQSICFQQPYQKWSPEELRLADYNQGRRYGNASNQPGAFGSTNFGSGFGNTNTGTTGAFGASNTGTGSSLFGGGATSSPFGSSQPASTGFGSTGTTGNNLFGQQKPATGGLFGQPAATQPSGGLFGGTTTSGFGSTGTTGFGSNTNTGSSLFGNNNNTANKPAFSFGTSQPASSATTGFGASTTTGFGGGGLFGNAAAQPQQASTAFGAQQPAASNPFGGFGSTTQQTGTSGGIFGNNQQKPAGGLFGAPASTGTGLFGNTSTTNSNPFGGSTNTNTSGLFGNKPATSGGLFGNNNTQTNTGGGLFSGFGNQNQNQQQQNTGGLFGGLNNNNQQKSSLFGAQPQQQTGGGLFGNSGNQQQQSGMFGGLNNSQQQQQPQNSLFGTSIFGGSQQGQQTPQSLTASINDNGAYGSASLFSNLASTQVNNPGPIATPLSSSINKKKPAQLPMYKLNSASSNRFITPQKRGFGFSYSNYGTPSSTSSTPGNFGGSLLGGGSFGGSFGRTLNKSMSTSSLRRSFNSSSEDSILAPGAFTASPSFRSTGSTGSIKRLTINKQIRSDLFTAPTPQQPTQPTPTSSILKKRVSFDAATNGNGPSSPLKQVNNAAPSAEELGYLRPRASVNGSKSNGASTPPEMEQVNNNQQLAIVNEEEPAAPVLPQSPSKPVSQEDQKAGDYYMKPSREEIEGMNRVQRAKVSNFVVGRHGIGEVAFDVPVDLTSIQLDEICNDIVQLEIRSATVYAVASKKPPMGKGLNVPSTISLANSWPRKNDKKTPSGEKSGARFKKHIERLKRVPDTTFVSYDKDTGVWKFKVEHFTTYQFPGDEEDETDGEGVSEFGQSTLSAPPDTPTPKTRTPKANLMDQSFTSTSQVSQTESDPDDTFEFRKKKLLPGAFDDQEMFEDEDMENGQIEQYQEESFLDERSVGSQSEDIVDEPMDRDDVFQDDESVSIMDQEMAGSYPDAVNTAELEDDSQYDNMGIMQETPGAIINARMRLRNAGTPKKQFAAVNDWAATLETTVSPKKRDRALLKSLLDDHGNDSRLDGEPTPIPRRVISEGFATQIDIYKSLYSTSPKKLTAKSKGFQLPYPKRAKTGDYDTSKMSDKDRAFHDSMKPSWGPDGTLVYAAPSGAKPFGRSSRRARERDGLLTIEKGTIVSENRDVRFAKFSNEASGDLLETHKNLTVINESGHVPVAILREGFSFAEFFDAGEAAPRDPAAAHEKLVWQLASTLFDPIPVPDGLQNVPGVSERLRKDELSAFWQKLVDDACTKQIAITKSSGEHKAITALAGHRIQEACGYLLENKDFHLATLVALIGSKNSTRKDMREQLNEWQKSQMLSEFTEPIRAIYELLAGNVCVCTGSKGQPEDRIASFSISKYFGLDWRQAFGLRLWYGTMPHQPLQEAVKNFLQDLNQDKEVARPIAWYVEQKLPALWKDEFLDDREDLLWGLLKLYTIGEGELEKILDPENSQLSPLDIRLAWQLSQALTATGAVRYSGDEAEAEDKADRTTLSFAAQLTNEGSWLDAAFVLLHLTKDDAREKALQDHLAHHAGKIGTEDSQSFATLTQNLKIPASWIWEAKALYMRSVERSPRGEVECLVKAGSFIEAHHTLSREVAPKCVVELDYDTLRNLLDLFNGQEDTIPEWRLGGEIYQDFLALIHEENHGFGFGRDNLDRLMAGLPAVVEESRHPGFMETVAIETISGVVAKKVIALGKQGEKTHLHKVLRLPLTEDKYLKLTVELSLEYYRSVMAGAR